MITPRPYQQRAIDSLRRHIRLGRRRVVLVAPTGSGKGVIAALIIMSAHAMGARVLFAAHRKELLEQVIKHLEGLPFGVVRADDKRTNPAAPIQLGSISTLARREPQDFDVILVDEAHRALGDTYVNFLAKYPAAQILGMTATPCRLDGKPLADAFDALEVAATYSELLALGHIVASTVFTVEQPVDLGGIHTQQGDYKIDELESEMMKVCGDVVKEWVKHAEGRRSLIFACTVKHSVDIVLRFKAAGIDRIEHLDGSTSEKEREAILGRLESGETLIVSNVAIVTEGFDAPWVKYVGCARPTKSMALWRQMSMRNCRPWMGIKPVLVDHGENVPRLGLPFEDVVWSLQDTPKLAGKSRYRTCPACYGYVLEIPCELCGHKPEVIERKIQEAPAVLVNAATQDLRRAFFVKMLNKASVFGFKPGYASALYKEEYGEWPPWSWSEEAREACAKDVHWQYRLEKRAKEKEFYAAQEATEPVEPEELFGGWLDKQ